MTDSLISELLDSKNEVSRLMEELKKKEEEIKKKDEEMKKKDEEMKKKEEEMKKKEEAMKKKEEEMKKKGEEERKKEVEMNKFYSSISILNKNIQDGYVKMDSIQRQIGIIDKYAKQIELNKNFTFKQELTEIVQIKNGPGQFATNCICCNKTCHFPCTITDNDDKHSCSVMDSSGYCTNCRCHWSLHKNMPYRYEYKVVEKIFTKESLKEKYDDGIKKKLESEQMLENAKREYRKIWDQIKNYLTICKESIDRLQKNANGPITLHRVAEIKHQIEEEKQQCKSGWKERMGALQELLQQHKLIEAICQGRENDILPKRI